MALIQTECNTETLGVEMRMDLRHNGEHKQDPHHHHHQHAADKDQMKEGELQLTRPASLSLLSFLINIVRVVGLCLIMHDCYQQ